MPDNPLSKEDREFFSLIRSTIFSNPFEGVRERVVKVTGKASLLKDKHHYDELIPLLEDRLHALEEQGIHSIRDLDREDSTYLEHAYLFLVYDRYYNEFNELIKAQRKAGDEPVPVEFAESLLFDLDAFGISKSEALRYLTLFYQLRRAYFFIEEGLIGHARCMTRLRRSLWNNVFTHDVLTYGNHLWNRMEDFSTLLLGETGTGKGTAAAAIGQSGLIPFNSRTGCFESSFTSNFIETNLSQFPESLIESELFGHRKGAFTGAIDHHQGLFERCTRHGSLFLDEIGDLSIPNQIKLLKVLEDRKFSPVGSHKALRFHGRVIAATHRPVHDLINNGDFRQDFYFRLSSDVIHVPSLRQRLDESTEEMDFLIPLIVERLTGNTDKELIRKISHVIDEQVPEDYNWPGNVRELEQIVRRIILNNHIGELISLPHNTKEDWQSSAAAAEINANELLSSYCQRLYQQYNSYVKVAEITGLDRRTVKKYIQEA